MSKTLYLFLFSPQTDSYVNALSYTYDKMKIESVVLIYVKGTPTGLNDADAIALSNKIWNRIEQISQKASIYKQINDRLIDRQLLAVDYKDLKIRLRQIVKRTKNVRDCIVDITGASKVPSIDVFSVCLAIGIKSVYTFELIKRIKFNHPNFDSDSVLYHQLNEQDYSYTCLTNTEPVKSSQASLLRRSSLFWYIGVSSLLIMLSSAFLLIKFGSDNLAIQGLNMAAALVGVISPVIALAEQKQKNN